MSQTLLKLQVGPVQDFIAQARSTRDLWSGSYLLSWLMAHVIEGLTSASSEVRIVYPALAVPGAPDRQLQPLVRYLRLGSLPPGSSSQTLRIATLPNVILALVPGSWTSDEVGRHAVGRLESAWAEEVEACLAYYNDPSRIPFSGPETERFRAQADRFWEVWWQLWPMVANPPPPGHKGDPWAWHYTQVSRGLEARRGTRDFHAWSDSPLARRDKDALSGREEAIADKSWLGRARQHPQLRYRFRNGDQLGGPNLVKRVWDLAYLRNRHPVIMDRRCVTYDSVPAVAAAPWLARLRGKLEEPPIESAFWAFVTAALALAESLPAEILPRDRRTVDQWLDQVDAQVFHDACWAAWGRQATQDHPAPEPITRAFGAVRDSLTGLTKAAGLGCPGRYVAVIAFDGDGIGQWLSGRRHTPQLPFTQEWHAAFSGAMATYSTECVTRQASEALGQTIYAGGDDVLLMVPAENALSAAQALAAQFSNTVGRVAPGVTGSAGIAIGHFKEPLQDLVQAARDAEGRAKRQLQGNAVAVTLFKRSGETLEWAAKWDSSAFALLHTFQPHYRVPLDQPDANPAVTGRFPYRLTSALARFGADTPVNRAVGDQTIHQLALAEASWVIERQTRRTASMAHENDLPRLRGLLLRDCDAYLRELAANSQPLADFFNLFAIEAFIARQGE